MEKINRFLVLLIILVAAAIMALFLLIYRASVNDDFMSTVNNVELTE